MIVAIVSGTPAEVRADLAALAVRRASISDEIAAEVRLDLMDPPDPGVFADSPLPLIATCRRPRDGGRFRGGEGDRLDLLRRAAGAGARWVDVESDVLPSWAAVPRTSVIGSFHDFEATPADLPALVMRILGRGASVVKVATRTRSLLDLLTLSAAVRQAPGLVVAVGIGPSGAASRILADRLGSAWTYARWSARGRPGPPELEDAGIPELGELVDFFRGGRLDRDAPAFAVLGDRADESIGPRVFNRVFRERRIAATYVHLKTPSLAGLREICRLLDIRGLSVTTPFKEAVLAAADRVDDSAQVDRRRQHPRAPRGRVGRLQHGSRRRRGAPGGGLARVLARGRGQDRARRGGRRDGTGGGRGAPGSRASGRDDQSRRRAPASRGGSSRRRGGCG